MHKLYIAIVYSIFVLGNTARDFHQEIFAEVIGTFSLGVILAYFGSTSHEGLLEFVENFVMLSGVSSLIFFPMIRLFRYAYVYRAYFVLYVPYIFFVNVIPFIAYDTYKDYLHHSPNFTGSVEFLTILLLLLLIYTVYILIERRRGLFKKSVPGWRIQVLRSILTRRQKLTMAFPDRYIRYLETGNKEYLVAENGS